MQDMAEIDAVGRGIGAINLVVVRPDGSLFGTNTDAYGCIQNIRQMQPEWRPDAGPMAIIGAGGAARTAIWALADAGVTEIRIANRTHERALAVANDLGAPCKAFRWDERHDILDGAALLVNATNQGMIGQQPLDLRLDKLPKHAIVYDIVYNPIETPLLDDGAGAGQPRRARARHAAQPSAAGMEGLVRHRAAGDAGAAQDNRGDAVATATPPAPPRARCRPSAVISVFTNASSSPRRRADHWESDRAR